MTAAPTISITTSLVPHRDIALQSAAIATWRAHGWSVCSLNAAEEANHIQHQFPGVSVITAQRTGQKVAGKPLPLISDLLRTAAQNNPTAEVIGFVNSDIFIRPDTKLNVALTTSCASGAVMLPRVDVDHVTQVATYQPTGTEKYSIGYDGVFMSRNAMAAIPDSIFCIGMPFWDYWLPLILILKGQPIYSLQSPVALHVTHDTRWNQSIYVFFHALLSDALTIVGQQRAAAPHGALAVMVDMLQHNYNDIFQRATGPDATPADQDALSAFYDRIQEVVVHHIKAAATSIQLPSATAGQQ
jgi:hypothetical protein